MRLDQTFSKEIQRVANGDGSRDAQWAFRSTVLLAQEMLSTPKVRTLFDRCIKTYGRVPVAICVAVTIIVRHERLEPKSYQWALEVMRLWTNRPSKPIREFWFAVIDDGLHPTRIEEYAGSFMRLTTEEP